MESKAFLSLALLALFPIGGAVSGYAQNFEPAPSIETPRQELSLPQRKIQPLIRSAVASLKSSVRISSSSSTPGPAATQLRNRLLRVDSRSRVQLYIQLSDSSAASITALKAAGQIEIELMNSELKIVQAWVPYDQIETVAAVDVVQSVRAPDYAIFHTGSVTTQGDAILKANTVRSTLGFTGAGIKVGVMSSGDNNAAASQATGDLPATITSFGTCDPSRGSECDEGTAIMEIIYDLAPGVSLAMGDVDTSMDFLQRVNDLSAWGAKVIVDDIAFLNEPFFEDGPLAKAYANAVAQGIVVISAAGNEAQDHYQGVYLDASGSHDFGGGDTGFFFSGFRGNEALILLEWSDPFGAAADNYDLCALTIAGAVITCSRNPQSGTQDPVEVLDLFCGSTSTCTGKIQVQKISGSSQTLEILILGASTSQHDVAADSIFGHAAASGVISVGAIDASDPGNVNIETYSSQGPSSIFFPAPVQRATPTLSAVDCVAVTGAGGFPKDFCGTSAAAPHIAAIAALMLQAKPSLTPAQVATLLQNNVIDRGAPGFDNTYGAGLAGALDTILAELGTPLPVLTTLSPASAMEGSGAFALTLTGSNFGALSVVRWNGVSRPTTFVSATQLTAAIPASDLAAGGTAQITVFTPPPGGGSSTAIAFTINNPMPTLSSLSPLKATVGGQPFALTAIGANFTPDSVVRWNGSDLPTTLGSATQLTALVPATDVSVAGSAQITVFTPTPGGGISAAVVFHINPAPPVPTFTPASLVNGASFTGLPPVPGAIAALFGTNLASGPANASGLPLRTTLLGTTVSVNNIPAPLYFVSPTQINFQIPWELAGASSTSLSVSVDTGFTNTSGEVLVNLSSVAPGIFSLNSQGTGQGAVLISNTATYAAPANSVPGSSARPANRGEFITIYCTGLGAVSNPPASGAAAGSSPTSMTLATPTVSIGGVQVQPSFSGLSPGFVGLYQVDLPVPANAPTGNAVPVTLLIGGVLANTVTIAIQ